MTKQLTASVLPGARSMFESPRLPLFCSLLPRDSSRLQDIWSSSKNRNICLKNKLKQIHSHTHEDFYVYVGRYMFISSASIYSLYWVPRPVLEAEEVQIFQAKIRGISAWRTMDRGLWHCTGGSDQHHPWEKEIQKEKMVVWGRLRNSRGKKTS